MENVRLAAGAAACLCILLLASAAESAFGAPVLDVSRTAISFGRVATGVEFTQPLFMTNVGDELLALTGFAINGKNASDYRLDGPCTAIAALAPGERCRLDVLGSLSPIASSATLTIKSSSASGPVDVALSGNPSSDITRGIYATPPWIDFDRQPVGTTSAPLTLTLTNPEKIFAALDSVTLGGKNPSDFAMTTDCAIGQRYGDNTGCAVTFTFTPVASGPRSAEVTFQMHPNGQAVGFVTLTYSVTGFGGVVTPVYVVEYYNASLDHYFITWNAVEQANLDAGKTPTKWSRTGYSFRAYATAQAGTSPVCRYYLPPQFGDSHFFGRGSAECNATGVAHPAFVLEDPQFMQMVLPTGGACPAGTTPIYRVFSNRPDANHRYMTDRAVRDAMVAKGWLAEGDGPDLVVMCAP